MALSPRALAVTAALTGAAAYGINIPAAKLASDQGIAPLALIALRSAVLLAAMLAAAPVLRQTLSPKGAGTALAGLGIATALTGAGYLSSLAFLPVSSAVVIFYSFPLWLILIAWARDRAISAARLAGFALAFAGILMVVNPGASAFDWRGGALALTASIAAAMMFELTPLARAGKYIKIFWAQVPSLALSLAVILALGLAPGAENLKLALWPVIITCAGFYIGFVLQIIATPHLSPAAAGLLFLFEPVVAIAASVYWLGEPLGGIAIAGAALVLAGLSLDTAAGFRAQKQKTP